MEPDSDLDDYFKNAILWYNDKYLTPLCHRSYSICSLTLILLLLLSVSIQMYKLFPAEKVLTYAVGFNNPETTKGIKIVPANYMAGSPLTSIAKIVVENYVINRERYKYADLKDQIVFVNSNSTKSIFNQYYNFINIDNPLSPVLRYQDQITREITPLISIFKSDTAVDVQFRSIARNSSDKIIEQMLWQASLEFKVDPIVLNQPTGTKFNFLVTNYKIKLLKNENK